MCISALSVYMPAWQKRASDPVTDGCEPATVWVLRIEFRSSGRTANAFNYQAISPAPKTKLFWLHRETSSLNLLGLTQGFYITQCCTWASYADSK